MQRSNGHTVSRLTAHIVWSTKNRYIKKQISPFIKVNNSLIDLGCGTGLGYRLSKSVNPNIKYLGIDFSSKMIKQFLKINN